MDYVEMLKRAKKQLPTLASRHKRFEAPKPQVSIIGPRTILHNFKDICDVLDRSPFHLLKFLSKEMATSGVIERNRAIFQGRFPEGNFTHLIKRYTEEFVTCPICRRPDTKIVKEKRFYFLVCDACGARSSIRSV